MGRAQIVRAFIAGAEDVLSPNMVRYGGFQEQVPVWKGGVRSIVKEELSNESIIWELWGTTMHDNITHIIWISSKSYKALKTSLFKR